MSTPSSDAVDRIVGQLQSTGRGYYALAGVTTAALLWFLFVVWTFVTQGHAVTNLGDWGTRGGVPWGLDIAAFNWWAALGVGAVTVAAAITLFRPGEYEPYARIGALLGPFAFLVGFLHVLFDLGRPDRVFITVLKHPLSSPIIWDIVILGGLGTLATAYVVVDVREDLAPLRERGALPSVLGPVYDAVLFRYDPESGVEDRVTRGLAAVILVYGPLTAGGAVPLFLSASGRRFDWFGAIQGPSFVLGGLATGAAAVALIAATLRHAYGWADVFDDSTLAGLGAAAAAAAAGYLLLVLFNVQSGTFGPIFADADAGTAAMAGALAPLFWIAVLSILGATASFTVQRVRGRANAVATAGTAALLLVGVFLSELWTVVGGQLYSELMYTTGQYVPSWTELSNVLGTVAVVTFVFLIAVKAMPIVPLDVLESEP